MNIKPREKSITVTLLGFLLLASLGVIVYLLMRGAVGGPEPSLVAGDEQTATTSGKVLLVDMVKRKGTVDLPESIDQSSLLVVSHGDVSQVSDTGEIDVPVYEEGVTIVAAMPIEGEIGLLHVVINGDSPHLTIMSTAEALVFSSPYITSADPVVAREIMNVISSDSAVKIFAKEIERIFLSDRLYIDDSYMTAYIAAVQSVVNTLGEQ